MRRHSSPRVGQIGRLLAAGPGALILSCHMAVLPVFAQDLDLALGEESGLASRLAFTPEPDRPAGRYSQAVERKTFDVMFVKE